MKKAFFVLITILILQGCGNQKVDVTSIKVDAGFSNYISAFTSGVISSSENIQVILIQPIEGAKAGEPLAKDMFNFQPDVEGEAFWVDNQTIEFRPKTKLKAGTGYKANFNLGKLLEVSKEFQKMEFGFVTMHQNFFVQFSGIRPIDTKDFSKQEVFGTVRTADVVTPSELEACFKAKQGGEELPISWIHNVNSKTHIYTIQDVIRKEKEDEVVFRWDGNEIGAEIEDDIEIRIPPLSEFSVMQANTIREPGLYFSILFSDPLDPEQDLNGLIYLESGRKLRLKINSNEVRAYPIGSLSSEETVIVDKNISNTVGKTLNAEFLKVIQFNMEKPAIELIGDGVIMPSEGELNFPFKAINLKAVNIRILRIYENNIAYFFQQNKFDGSSSLSRYGRLVYDDVIDLVSTEAIDYGVWNNFKVDLNKLIQPEPGAIYRVMMSFERYQSLYPCGDSNGVVKPMKRNEVNFDSGDHYFSESRWFEGWSNYQDRDNPCSDSYFKYYSRSVARNVFASNYGIIAKEGAGNTFDVIVSNLKTTEAEQGVTIEAFNYQNQLITSAKTNGQGLAHFAASGKPYLLVAKKGSQRGYLRVDDGSSLSMSLFDVGGNKIKEGVKGFIYGERGVWRPGDTLFLSFILEDKRNTIPASHPIVMELYDPLGKLYDKKVSSTGVKGMYAFTFTTEDKAPTGNWRAKAIVGNSEFNKTLKVETIKPNRIRIDLDLPEVISAQEYLRTTLTANWLYGSPASNLDAQVELEIRKMKTSFEAFPDYQFDDRSKSYYSSEPIIVKGTTTADGDVSLNFNWDTPDDAPGMLKMKLSSKVFESGGDFSQDFISRKFSPYNSYAGIKLPGGTNWLNALNSEEDHAIAIAAVDQYGKPVNRKLKVELYKVSHNWWWEGDGTDELTRYINRRSSDLIQTDYYRVENGKGFYTLEFPERGWGKYLLRVIDLQSGHSALQEFYADYPGWYGTMEGNVEAASMINLETDKEEYAVNEEAEITVPSGGLGKLYITVEKGDKVIDQFWVEAQNKATKFKLKTTSEMAPNVYVNAVLIQPHGQEKNSMPIRMFGIANLKVSDPETHLQPVLQCLSETKPESTFNIKVKEQSGKAMAYTLAVVDEGLLSLTRFKTPDPWPVFYAKEALGVKSWDMYKYVMDAEAGKMASLLAVGGDEELVFKEDAKANRFKPVVKYLGPFYLEKGKEQQHTVHIPNYIGAVRVMVVAAHEGSYGKAEKEVKVKKPLMVLTTLPRVLGPLEKITIPVNVITMDDKIKNVKVKVSSNGLLTTSHSKEKTVTFTKAGEQTVFFDFDVANKLGVAKFKAEVFSSSHQSYEELEILVRPANPPVVQQEFAVVESKDSWHYSYEAFGIKGTRKVTLQLSSIPDLQLEKQLSYLIRYPHGCIEQTTSAVFPQLYLGSFVNLSDERQDEIDKNIQAALNKYRNFQTSSGGFSYWPGEDNYISEWGSNYAGHFMVEAGNKGYDLPAGMLSAWVKFQKEAASNWSRSAYHGWGRYNGDLTQAYRLYTLALAGHADIGAMNRLKRDNNLSNMGAWRLAAAYAIIGQEEASKELVQRDYSVEDYRAMSYGYGSAIRDRAMVLETMTYLKKREEAGALLLDIAKELKNSSWHSTQTRAYVLLAMGKYLGANKQGGKLHCTITINGKDAVVQSDLPIYSVAVGEKHLKAGHLNVENESGQPLFVNFIEEGIPTEDQVLRSEKDLNMTVEYVDLYNNPIDVTSLKQGQDFKAVVRIKHPGIRAPYEEIALNQLFPSGWQIVNTRLHEEGPTSQLDYQDIRDDRVYSYFDLEQGERIEIEVKLNATFLGKFYQPAIFCAPMYDESISSVMPGRWVEVVR